LTAVRAALAERGRARTRRAPVLRRAMPVARPMVGQPVGLMAPARPPVAVARGRSWLLIVSLLLHAAAGVGFWLLPHRAPPAPEPQVVEIVLEPVAPEAEAPAEIEAAAPPEAAAEAPAEAMAAPPEPAPIPAAEAAPPEPSAAVEPSPEPAPAVTPPDPTPAEPLPAQPLQTQPPPRPTPPRPRAPARRPSTVAPAGPAAEPATAPAAPALGPGPAAAPARAMPQSYLATLFAALERHKRYPESARWRRAEGTAIIQFTMRRDGQVTAWRIARGSGHDDLDVAVGEMIQRASPLPAPPADFGGETMQLALPVRFSLR
jgi:protein TonB